MPFYFRKSVSAGPFRFNLSKSGVGVSVGVKGLRLGTGPRGHYIRAGLGGVHYQVSTSKAGERKAALRPKNIMDQKLDTAFAHSPVKMVEIESGDVLSMRNEAQSEILDELNAKQKQYRISRILAISISSIGIATFFAGHEIGAAVVAMALPAWAIGRWLDASWRTAVLFYDLDSNIEKNYKNIADSFDNLNACRGKWRIDAGGAVQDITTWKRNAGAAYIVNKSPLSLEYKLPAVIRCNLTPPMMRLGRRAIYIFPDFLLIEENNAFGVIDYERLKITWQDSNFIEEGTVPKDAIIVSHTWKHPNKTGGPDRRFRNNHQIPVCRYEAMHLKSESGLNELVEFSRSGVAQTFASALRSLPKNVNAAHRLAPIE